jgi:hypothetical protein
MALALKNKVGTLSNFHGAPTPNPPRKSAAK